MMGHFSAYIVNDKMASDGRMALSGVARNFNSAHIAVKTQDAV